MIALKAKTYASAVQFAVARNPDTDSRLPYLVRLPIEGGLVLEVRDTSIGPASPEAAPPVRRSGTS